MTPPTLGIDALTADKSILYKSGNIALGGVISDDRGVAGVDLQFTAATGSTVSIPATIANGKWSLTIASGLLATDPNYGNSLGDGEQLISVLATDSSGKVSKNNLTIYVDNKAPTVLVTSPLTMAAERPTVTNTIVIKGEVWDASPITDVTVTILEPDGTVFGVPKKADGTATWLVSIPLSGANSLYYFNVKVTDKAGNVNKYYYHRTGIIQAKDPLQSFPIIDDLGKMDQKGIPTAGITTAKLQAAELAIDGNPVPALGTYADFFYDSSPAMSFSFSNIDRSNMANQNLLPSNSVLVGIISPPVGSGAAIDKTTVKAEFRIGSGPWASALPALSYTGDPILGSDSDGVSLRTLGDSVSFTYKLPDTSFPLGEYQVKLSAATDLDATVKQDPSPVFFMIDSGVPTITETTLDPSNVTSLYQNAPFKLQGVASDNSGISKIEIFEQKDSNASVLVQTITGLTGTSPSYASNFLPSSAPSAGGSYYNYKILLTSMGGKTATLYRSTSYDATPPTVGFANVAPQIGTNTVNGNLSLTLTATDASGINAVRRWIRPAAAAAPTWSNTAAPVGASLNDGYLGEWTSGPYASTIDTAAASTPNGSYKIWAMAVDKAGNYATAISYAITIDQSTDLPVISLTNIDPSVLTAGAALGNLFGSGASIQGTISDDDMVDAAATRISIDGAAGIALSSPGTNKLSNPFQHAIAALPEGTHRFNITAYDLASAKNVKPAISSVLPASGDIYFMIDLAPPNLAVTSPAISGTFEKGNFTISGTASDSNALAGSVQIKNGAIVLYSPTVSGGNWSQLINPVALGLTEGVQNWTLVVSDVAGKQTSLPFSYSYDKTAPVVTIANPAAASWNSGAMLTASGAVSDASAVTLVEYSKDSTNGTDGTWATTSGTVSWSVDLTLATLGEGNKTIWLRATDAAGNTSTAISRNFGIDLNPPAVTETVINTSATSYKSAIYTLGGVASDSNALASILVTEKKDTNAPANVLSSALSGTGQSWSTVNLPLGGVANGTYVYSITTTDIAGKTASLTRTVIIDTSAPTVSIVNPIAGLWLTGSAYLINGNSADVGPSGVALVEYSLSSNTGPWSAASGTTNWNANISLTPEGAKNLYLRATDAAGNVSAVSSVAFGADQYPPSLTETTIGVASTTKQSVFSFGGGASDSNALATLHGLTVSVNGGAATDISVAGGVWSYTVPVDTLTHTNDASNTYVFTATDVAGRTTTLSRIALIDTTAPIITITAPISGQWISSSNPTITGVATDGLGSGVNKVYVLVDNAATDHSADAYTSWTLASGTGSWSAPVSLSGEGLKKVWVKSVDNAGNVTTAASTLNFGYDASPPNLTETVNGTSTQTYKANFSLGGAASDSNSLSTVTVSINGGAANAATLGAGTWSYNIPVDSATHTNDGNLSIVITATDAAGKTTIVNRAAIIDTKAPTITMINPDPAGTSWLGGTSYVIKGSADDGVGVGVGQVWIKVDAAAVDHSADAYTSWTMATGSSSFSTVINPVGLGDGAKKIWVKAVDSIGNVSTSATTVLFGVDSVNPVLAFTAPAGGQSINQAFTISGTAADSNLAQVSYSLDGAASTSLGAVSSWNINLSAATVSGLVEGQHSMLVSVSDAAGNTVSNTLNFQKDSTAPQTIVNTLNASTGYSSSVVQDTTPLLTGTLSDNIALAGWNYRIERWTDNANLAGATWTAGSTMAVVKDWNGTPFAISGTSQSFSIDLNAILGGSLGLPLPDGRYRLLINAVDGSQPANTSAAVVREFRLDRGVPSLAVATPASQGLYMGADFSVSGTAGELNGIQSVSLKFDSSDFSSGTIYTATLGGSATAATWSTTMPTALVVNGPHLVWVQATAYSGKTSLQSVSVNIDKTAPTVAITSNTNGARVTGQLVVAGTAGDNTVLSKVQYRFGLNASTWYDMPNGALYSWSYTIPDVSAYANATYAREINPTTKVDQPGSNIWLMPFEVRAIDQAGNITAVTIASSESANRFYFMIDPLGDLPTSDIYSPADGASLGGEINIYGGATDNTWVKSMTYQVSQDGTTWTDGVSSGSAGGSSSPATIVGNPGPTISWSAKINSNGWMSPSSGTKTIYFRIHATDSKDFGATAGVNGTDKQISIVLNSSIPQIKNVVIDPDATAGNGNDVAYSSGVKAAGVFYVRAEVYTPVGLSDLKRVEQGPLSGQVSELADGSVVTLPNLKTAGSFVTGRKYLISSIGSTDFTLIGGVNTIGKTFTAGGPGSGSGTAYEAESSGLYQDFFKYLVTLQINSNTLGSGQFANTSGVYAFNLQAIDLTTPAPFQTSTLVSVQIDNYFPTSNGMNSLTNISGTSFAVQGQVTDVGAGSGTVAGVTKVVAYLTRSGQVVNLRGGAASAGVNLPVKDFAAGGAMQSVLFAPTESGTRNYSFNVSSYSETPGNDADTANGGNADGFEDKLTYNGSAVDWYGKFDSTAVADGPAILNYVIFDSAGNASHYTQSVFIANNPPQIVQVTLGTDLNGDSTIGNVASGESVAYNPAQFATTNFTARGSSLSLTVSASGGNGTMFYSVKFGAAEQNATLTSNSVNITNFIGIGDSAVANDRSFTIFVYDSTPGTTPGVDSLSVTKTISMTIKNTDIASPTVTMVPLYWTSASDNSLYGNSAANGHINFGSMTAPLNDINPKVSGQIKFSGTLSDDQRIQYVTMTIGNGTTGYDFAGGTAYGTSFVVAQWNPGTKTLVGVDNWVSRGWKFVVSSENLTSSGHSANWELDWDTSKLNAVAGTGIAVTVKAQDYRNAGSLGSANLSTTISQTIDVVPYITSVTTLLSNLNSQNTSVFNRTALGRYPVNASETIKLNGFNLTGATITGIASGITFNAGVVSVPMSSASTGYLPLLVNSIPLVNNLDNNAMSYNLQPNGINNNLLTNDVALDVWQFNNRAAVPISGQIAGPVMKINPVSGKIGFAFTNGPLYFSMGGTVAGTEYSYNYWQASYDFLTSVTFAYDSAGHTYGTAAGGDINSNSADKFSFMTDRWGISGLAQTGSYNGANALRMESIGQVNGGVNDFNKYRIKSPSYATSRIATSPNSTNIYLAYYDDMNTEIRFRYGNLLDSATTKTNFTSSAAVNAGSFVVGRGYTIAVVGSTNFTNIGAASNTVGVSFVATGVGAGSGNATPDGNFYDSDVAGAPGPYSTVYKSIVAGSTTGRNAGEFVSIGVIPGATVSTDVVVMVWYDATNQSLWYSYNTTPTVNRAGTATAAGWSTPMQIFANAGQYCQVAVDAGGGIHIAAYDIVNANLLYAHLTSYTDTSPKTSVVDSYGIVGTDISLDVAKVGSNYIPYIGYYAQSSIRPKYAYLVDTSAAYPDGATNDAFTGAWEVTLLPTTSSVPNDNINVGVWKDAAGVLKNSVTGTSAYTKTGSGYTAINFGQVFGNGTSNGVLAYQIKESTNGYIETAQKK